MVMVVDRQGTWARSLVLLRLKTQPQRFRR
jgi:hypothetical protein